MKTRTVPATLVDDTLVPHQAYLAATSRLDQCFTYAHGAREPVCFALVGESRTGKSRTLEEFFDRHPITRNDDGLSIPILRVATPSKPTVKSLVEVMLKDGMHDELATSGSENQKTNRLIKLMKECDTQMVMIDEFHHFVDKGSHKVIHHVADWLKVLVDKLRCVLVVAGLPICQSVLAQNEQLQGRFYAPVIMPRFNWEIDDQRVEFVAILGSFQESLSRYFDLPPLDGDEMAFRSYCGSGGLMGYLTKFLRKVVWNAIDQQKRRVTLLDLATAHEEAVWAKFSPGRIPNPFSKEFHPRPSEELLSLIRKIGTSVESPLVHREHKGRSKGPSVRDVLSAR
ncbi:TniB family NTP-binding protein [Paraburkholderia azotifigens]|uniref:AAA family ATPase n=1 Tax=Paraburkholderia azotifigens TaxID=2057004 RepID=A0A5C6VAD2_9BURK|nr:TniB family NTP-binding protein [Paraburkholderia azotifigens]TXC82452.1 AAA family ATPase [Paraburkholderia azotifigens]